MKLIHRIILVCSVAAMSAFFWVHSWYGLQLVFSGSTDYEDTRTKNWPKWNSKASENSEIRTSEKDSRPLRVLVSSSMARSGSTLLGEVLKTGWEDAIYYFEPDKYIGRNSCISDEWCIIKFLKSIYLCNPEENFEKWLKTNAIFFHYYNSQAESCNTRKYNYTKCVEKIDLISNCKMSSFLLIKNIRTRLKIAEHLLKDKSINLKVVHLSRDPRASLLSMTFLGWRNLEKKMCGGLLEDMIVYPDLKKKFPNQVTSLRYESFCLNPWEEITKLFAFLFNTTSLPQKTIDYLRDHLRSTEIRRGILNTYKDPKPHFEGWRSIINPEQLKTLENEPSCRASIVLMEHRLFGNEINVRNLSLDLVIKK